MELRAAITYQQSATSTIALFTDGGGTAVLTSRGSSGIPGSNRSYIKAEITGTTNEIKTIYYEARFVGGTFSTNYSATNNAGIVNCVRFGSANRTASAGSAILLGWRKA
jgi:hypothetical protein